MPDHVFAARLGAALKTALLCRDMTTEELARRAGYSVESVRRWTRGDTNISAEDLARIADVLDLPADMLLSPPDSRGEALVRIATHDARRASDKLRD